MSKRSYKKISGRRRIKLANPPNSFGTTFG